MHVYVVVSVGGEFQLPHSGMALSMYSNVASCCFAKRSKLSCDLFGGSLFFSYSLNVKVV